LALDQHTGEGIYLSHPATGYGRKRHQRTAKIPLNYALIFLHLEPWTERLAMHFNAMRHSSFQGSLTDASPSWPLSSV
jgi:hypothetical protein